MRQFILASDYGTAAGQVTLVNDKTLGTANLVLKRNAADGGDILYPIYPKDLTYGEAAEYNAATAFKASFVISEVNESLDYTVIFVKKGKQFNERNKWSCTIHAKKSDTPTTIATAIVEWSKLNKETLGLTVTNSAGTVTVQGPDTGEAYKVVLADELIGTKVTVTSEGTPAFMDANMIKDLAAKCAADMGYNYTEDDELYPNYPIQVTGTSFDVYTLRFTEPRVMGTREEAVYQIIQVAFPTGKGAGLITALNSFSGKSAAAASVSEE